MLYIRTKTNKVHYCGQIKLQNLAELIHLRRRQTKIPARWCTHQYFWTKSCSHLRHNQTSLKATAAPLMIRHHNKKLQSPTEFKSATKHLVFSKRPSNEWMNSKNARSRLKRNKRLQSWTRRTPLHLSTYCVLRRRLSGKNKRLRGARVKLPSSNILPDSHPFSWWSEINFKLSLRIR